jgi:hypothetical protein
MNLFQVFFSWQLVFCFEKWHILTISFHILVAQNYFAQDFVSTCFTLFKTLNPCNYTQNNGCHLNLKHSLGFHHQVMTNVGWYHKMVENQVWFQVAYLWYYPKSHFVQNPFTSPPWTKNQPLETLSLFKFFLISYQDFLKIRVMVLNSAQCFSTFDNHLGFM